MPGVKTEREFDVEDYDHFYTDEMHFVELSEEQALRANEHIPRFGWAFDIVEELKPKNLVDLGCLEGSFILTVANQLGLDVTGVEMNKEAVTIGRERAKKHGLKAKFYQSSAEDFLGKTKQKFDVITCFEVLEHVKDPTALLKLIDKALAPGGTVLVSTPAFESPTYGKDDEQNKCHIRLYTMKDDDYEEYNKYGTLRKATSITKQIGKDRIKEMAVYSELINLRYV